MSIMTHTGDVTCPVCEQVVTMVNGKMLQHFYRLSHTHRMECDGSLKNLLEAIRAVYGEEHAIEQQRALSASVKP